MKNALILHGTGGKHTHNWFPWLKAELEKHDYKVWVPDLPGAEKPNIERYNKFLLEQNDWDFNEESVIIGHSSGAVTILGLLQELPKGVNVDTCILVGVFKDNLGEDCLNEIFPDSYDFERLKKKAERFIFVHSDDDPYCPFSHAEYFAEKLDAELVFRKGQKHFSVGTAGDRYKEFSLLLKLLGL